MRTHSLVPLYLQGHQTRRKVKATVRESWWQPPRTRKAVEKSQVPSPQFLALEQPQYSESEKSMLVLPQVFSLLA